MQRTKIFKGISLGEGGAHGRMYADVVRVNVDRRLTASGGKLCSSWRTAPMVLLEHGTHIPADSKSYSRVTVELQSSYSGRRGRREFGNRQ